MRDGRTGCIYMATVLPSGRSYIGYTVDFARRKKGHLSGRETTGLSPTIRKYGEESVCWRILADGIPERLLPTHERYWIRFYDTYRNGYNRSEGGECNPMSTQEARAKVSASHRAKVALGEYHSQQPEWKAKASASHRVRAARGEHQMQKPENQQRQSEFMKSQAAQGNLWSQSDEGRAAMSEREKARVARGEHHWTGQEHRDAISAYMKMRHSRERLERWQDAGQQFLVPMEIE